MRRFFCSDLSATGDVCALSGQEAHHISNVLRMKGGDRVILLNGDGCEYEATLLALGDTVRARIISKKPSQSEPKCKITLYQGLAKGDKMEDLFTRCVEAGVSAFVPVQCVRSVVRWDKKDAQKKTERLEKHVLSACKQCGRAYIPQVGDCLTTAEAACNPHGLKLVAYEDESACSLSSAVLGSDAEDIAIFIGPEGGIDPKEIDKLKQNGWQTVSLGKRILRTENAGFAAAVLTLGLRGDMDARGDDNG